MEERVWNAALAGLLHDIGKFAQRAGILGSRSWDETAQKDFKYYHAVLTADFIDKYVPEPWRVPIKNAAGNHHRPSNRIEWALALADHLSAGERADLPSEARAAQPKQLLSIFCSLTSDGHKTPQDVYWPLNVLDFHSGSNKESLFPGEAWDESRVWKAYEGLWESFCREAGQLRDGLLDFTPFGGHQVKQDWCPLLRTAPATGSPGSNAIGPDYRTRRYKKRYLGWLGPGFGNPESSPART